MCFREILSMRSWPVRILWLVALVGAIYLAVLTAWLGLAGLGFPYQLDINLTA